MNSRDMIREAVEHAFTMRASLLEIEATAEALCDEILEKTCGPIRVEIEMLAKQLEGLYRTETQVEADEAPARKGTEEVEE